MAAGDLTFDSAPNRQQGNLWMLTGVVEVDDTIRTFAVTSTKSTLVDVQMIDDDGTGTPWCAINEDADGTVTNGTMAVAGNHVSTDTYRFRAYYI